jgi:hypothetical protein
MTDLLILVTLFVVLPIASILLGSDSRESIHRPDTPAGPMHQ